MNRDDVIAYIKEVHFGFLATQDPEHGSRVRPIGIHTVYDNCLYFFTFSNTRKVEQIEHDPRVEVVWSKLEEMSQVRMRGKVERETDAAIQHKFISDNPIVNQILTPDAKPLFQLYRLEPETIEVALGLVPYQEVNWGV